MTDEVEARVKKLKDQLSRLEALADWESRVLGPDAYTHAQKVLAFDALHAHCMGYMRQWFAEGREPMDGVQYIYENAMELTLGPATWNIIKDFYNLL